MTEALFVSLPSFLCFFSVALVTTSSIVEWIRDQLELLLVFQRERQNNKIKRAVSDVWAQRDGSSTITGLMLFARLTSIV